MNKIIQTPSHLGLFEKDTNIRPSNIRDSIATNHNRKLLTQQFFSKSNQKKLKDIIKTHVTITSIHDEEHINIIISNIFMDNASNQNITISLEQLNNLVLTIGINKIKHSLQSQKQFINDRNNIGGFLDNQHTTFTSLTGNKTTTSSFLQNPIVSSNKIDRQLPRSNFI